MKKCDNGPLGSAHQILSAEKSPGTPGFAVLSTAPFLAPPLQPRLYIHMYIYVQYVLIEVVYSSPTTSPAQVSLQNIFFAPTQNTFFSTKGETPIQPVSCRPGTVLKFSHFYNPDLLQLPCTGLNVAASRVLLKIPYFKIPLWRNHLLLTMLSKSKYNNKTWLRMLAQGEQIPFCSLPPLLTLLNSHRLQTTLRKKQLQ